MSDNWAAQVVTGALEQLDVADNPCDECGLVGQSKLYVDGHIFQLCAACAWKLTDEYRAAGHVVPWET